MGRGVLFLLAGNPGPGARLQGGFRTVTSEVAVATLLEHIPASRAVGKGDARVKTAFPLAERFAPRSHGSRDLVTLSAKLTASIAAEAQIHPRVLAGDRERQKQAQKYVPHHPTSSDEG